MASKKTKRPSGLTITRNRLKFVLAWNPGEKYEKQQLEWMVFKNKKSKWHKESITATAKKEVLSLTEANIRSTKEIRFRVRGYKKDTGWSEWVQRGFAIKAMSAPSLSYARTDSTNNQGTFTWNGTINNTNGSVFHRYEWQTILTNSNSQPSNASFKSSALGWQKGTATANGSKTITELTTNLTKSRARWFRVRAIGAHDSAWRYSNHVYGLAAAATITGRPRASENSQGGTTVTITWSTANTKMNPVSKTVVQYAMTTPESDLSCPDGASWTDGMTYAGARSSESAHFSIDAQLNEDNCLFARVNTTYDDVTTYGVPKIVTIGKLKTPTFTSIDVDTDTNRVTIAGTNNSEVAETYLRAYIVMPGGGYSYLGNIASGDASGTFDLPSDASAPYAFGLKALTKDNDMGSDIVTYGGDVPLAPIGVTAVPADTVGTITVMWDWSTWKESTGAEISWADHTDAWESTDEPSTYTITSLHASRWNISGLEAGKTWYIRVRLNKTVGDDTTNGPWSEMVTVDLSETPTTPALTLSKGIVTVDGSFSAAWAYSSGDGTAQALAEICEATVDEGRTGDVGTSVITYGEIIARTNSNQSITLSPADLGWSAGEAHYLAVRVTSASGRVSDGWSPVVPISVADAVTATLTASSLTDLTIQDDETTERTVKALTALPFTATLTGAGEGGITRLVIERAYDYHVTRPDDSENDGFAGETIVIMEQVGEEALTVNASDLIGNLDDGAPYNLVMTAKDNLGQFADVVVPFEVHWAHQPSIPTAIAQADGLVMTITPIAPADVAETDRVDIYRLSADAPTQIVDGGTFGTTYVDPYPAFGLDCGHRVVCRTETGDYISEDRIPAWVELDQDDGDIIDEKAIVITFAGENIALPYNISLGHIWAKDFERTTYLGGSVQGDWNPSVTRDLSASTVVPVLEESNLARAVRRLANYRGVCHVRTPDGSSFPADVQVSENRDASSGIAEFSLTIQAVDRQELEGMTVEEWQEQGGA